MNIISCRRKAGFTLTELMAVVIIVGILAAAAVGSFKKAIERSHFSEGLVAANTVLAAVESRHAEDMDASGSGASFEFNRPKIAHLDIALSNQRACQGVGNEDLPYCAKTKYFEILIKDSGVVDAVRMKGNKQGDYTIRVFPASFGQYQRASDGCIANKMPGGKDFCVSMGYTHCIGTDSGYCYKVPPVSSGS